MLPYANEHMPPYWHFQQDNDPKHKARIVTDFLAQNRISLLKTPAQSPDLNLIENFWDHMKKGNRDTMSRNLNVLWDNLQKRWDEIEAEFIGQLIQSMHNRCQAVIKAKGGATKY